jgi:nucleotide-binding universal stress UspA family protein
MAWLPKRKVVVPIDFSDDSFAAIDVARDLVDDPANIFLVHVLHDVNPLEETDAARLAAEEQQRIAKAKAAIEVRLQPHHKGMQIDAVVGDAGHALARYATDREADLIVMPSHGRTGLARMLIGSVTERVIRLARCPVLVIRK